MKTKIDLIKNIGSNRSWLGTALCHMMDMSKVSETGTDRYNIQDGIVELELRVNDAPVNFERWVKVLEDSHQQMLNDQAKKLIKDYFGDLENIADKLCRNALDKLECDVAPSWDDRVEYHLHLTKHPVRIGEPTSYDVKIFKTQREAELFEQGIQYYGREHIESRIEKKILK